MQKKYFTLSSDEWMWGGVKGRESQQKKLGHVCNKYIHMQLISCFQKDQRGQGGAGGTFSIFSFINISSPLPLTNPLAQAL